MAETRATAGAGPVKGDRVLVTGANGFIGSAVAMHLIQSGYHVVSLLRSCRGNKRLAKGTPFVMADIGQPLASMLLHVLGAPAQWIVHIAAETHVTRSIQDPEPFVRANVLGTMNVLDYARRCAGELKGFIYFSTDEVFGPTAGAPVDDYAAFDARNPYAATKAAGEELAMAYANTYGMPVTVTHCCNAFGEMQHAEKFVPLAVRAILGDLPLTLHKASGVGDGTARREWAYVGDVARAVAHVMALPDVARVRYKYNIGCGHEASVLRVAQWLAIALDTVLRYEIVEPTDRPGNDECYRSDCRRFLATGFQQGGQFVEALNRTAQWYRDNPHWLR